MDVLKFIADVNVEKPIIDYLSGKGYDVKWIPDYDCQILDKDLLIMANAENRILITDDKDFGELIFLQNKLSAGIILIRVKGQGVQNKVKLIKRLLQRYSDKLSNNFVIITDNKFRFISLKGIR